MFAAALLATLATSPALCVVDDAGAPIAAARLTFVDAHDKRDTIAADAAGCASEPRLDAVRAEVTAPGFRPATIVLRSANPPVRLARAYPVVATVRVATGSSAALHRLPVAASVLDRAAIATVPARTSDGLLRGLPGFDRTRSNSAFTNYGQLRVSLDGAGNDRGLVLVDGIPAQDAFGGQVDWTAYPVGEIDRAEVLRGPGSALYGSGAIGGVLDLRTLGPATVRGEPGASVASAEVGGNGIYGGSFFTRTQNVAGTSVSAWTSTANASYSDFPPGQRSAVDFPARSQSDANAVRLHFGASRASVDLSALHATDAQAQGRPNYTFSRTLDQFALQARYDGERTYESIGAYERNAGVTNVADQSPQKPGLLRYVQAVPTWEDGVEAILRRNGGDAAFEARAELRAVHGISSQFAPSGALQSEGAGAQTATGFAVQETVQGKRWEALAGARYDAIALRSGSIVTVGGPGAGTKTAPARTDAAISPRAALRYDLTPNVALRASAGSGIRAPYLNELVRGFNIGATVFAPNLALVPERSASLGAGIDVSGTNAHFAVDAFSTRVNDAIAFVTIGPTLSQRANVARTQTDGATATYDRRVGACERLRASVTVQHPRVVAGVPADVGKQLPFVAGRTATVGYDATIGDVVVGSSVSFLGQAFADDLNAQPLGGVTLLDASIGTRAGSNGTATLVWQNITNQIYLTSVDRLGAPATLSLRYTAGFGGLGDAGPPCRNR